MSRFDSIPPLSDARQARASFCRASEILEPQASFPPRRFGAEANEIRRVAFELCAALEKGSPLQEIDRLTVALQSKCLAIQQLTLVARKQPSR